jgi:hypothetical protein
MDNKPMWLKQIPERIGWYLTGFADGEGSFNVSLRKKHDYRIEWQVVLTFNVSQRDISNLVLLKRYLGCGRLQHRKDGVHYFVVGNNQSVIERVLPFFERFYFFSSFKKKNFSLFRRIAELVERGEHLNPEGFKKIVALREELNEGKGRKRKYNQDDVQINYQRFLRDYTSDPANH